MKKNYVSKKMYYLFLLRTAIEAKILFAVCVIKKQALTGGKSLACEDKCGKKIGAESAMFNFVFFVILKNKIEQSAKIKLLLNKPTDRTFENRRSRYKELGKKVPQAYRVYVEDTFLPCDAGDARIFSKDEDVYGIDYGFGLDAPKETEQSNPQDLFAYRRNYTWNERNLLTKSSDKNYTVHYRYGDDGQRALKYTDEGRSETLYFNNFFTIHIPTQDQNNPQGLRVHKHIFVGNSRLVTAMTHTDNSGDNDEQKAKRYYYHSDHLGSAQFVTDWRGKQYEHIEYTPYGELWVEEVAAGLDKLPFRFTGKELDEETGLYYYGARYLDPKYSRWLSGDPALNDYMAGFSVGEGGIYNTVNFNVYHYGGNNPIKYTDPTGEWVHIAIGAVIGAAISGISTLSAGGSTRDVVASLIGGAVTGGMAAATGGVSLGVTVAGSALAASTGYVVESIVAGREATIEGIVNSAAGGATGSMAGAILDKAVGMVSETIAQTIENAKTPSPYSNISDNTNIGAGKNFTTKQKQNILQANSNRNNGVVKSDSSGKILTKPVKSQAGVTPSQDEWQIDHIIPKSKGGTNSYSNAQVLSRQENKLKWDN